ITISLLKKASPLRLPRMVDAFHVHTSRLLYFFFVLFFGCRFQNYWCFCTCFLPALDLCSYSICKLLSLLDEIDSLCTNRLRDRLPALCGLCSHRLSARGNLLRDLARLHIHGVSRFLKVSSQLRARLRREQ